VTALAGPATDPQSVFALTGGSPFFVTGAGHETRRAGDVRDDRRAASALPAQTRHVLDFVSVIPSRAEIDLLRAHHPSPTTWCRRWNGAADV
jgi:hypothetical protein